MHAYRLTHLEELEAESIHILREVAAQFDRPALLFSGGKDSLLCFHLARKAFHPGRMPFPLLHIDTGHNFPETIAFRDALVEEHGVQLLVGSVQQSIDQGRVRDETGPGASRNKLQSVTLLDAIAAHRIDCAIGGGRRDEERARAKERVFSHRDEFGQWDPRNQRPELWDIYNGRRHPGEHFRAFPISNWTELDVWHYIRDEGIAVPDLYLSHDRAVFQREGVLYAHAPFMELRPGESVFTERVRFRTIGDVSCTGAVKSTAATIDEVIDEVARARTTERGTRQDDKRSEAAMEDRKREGYF